MHGRQIAWAVDKSLVFAESAIQRFHWDPHIFVILRVVDIVRMAEQEQNCILSWFLLRHSNPRHADNGRS